MDALVEFLFKYRPIVFENGRFGLGSSWTMSLLVLVLGIAAIAAIATYIQVRVQGSAADRRKLIIMRSLLLLVLVFVLLRPVLVVSSAFGRQNVVGVLIDDTRSMQIADMNGRTRADIVRDLFGRADSSLYKALDERFDLRFFRVSSQGTSPVPVSEITFDGAETRLASALEGTRQDLIGVPLAGVVLLSDGADNAAGQLTETLLALNARKVPVYAVGIGQERFAKDLELTRIESPQKTVKGAAVVMDVTVSHRGLDGQKVQVMVEDSGRVVAMEEVVLPKEGEATVARIRVPAPIAGARLFTVRAAKQDGEMVAENNARNIMVMVQDRRDKVLYVEGSPRPELKYLRQAIDEDQNLQLVTLMRTTKNKFMRMSVDDTLELATGFPTTREELFAYRAIVLGNIEASFFTVEQLRMIADFVSERGGGFMMLGGRNSFAEGGYAGTPIADILPIDMPRDGLDGSVFREVKVSPTPAGISVPVTQIAVSETASVKQWKKMPVLSSVNRILGAKPGAGTYLTGTPVKGDGKDAVVLAYHRYGQGRAFAFPVQDSWLWRMHADVPLEDESYRTFWRQVLRAMVNETPAQVVLAVADQSRPSEPIQVTALVSDKGYRKVNGATVSATVVTPSGSIQELPFEWSGVRDGEYLASFSPTEEGVHAIRVTSRSGEETTLSDPAFVNVGLPNTEFFGAELRTPLLRRVAEETGGRYYTPDGALGLAKDLVYSQAGNTSSERLDLWDMPILFIVLLGLMAAEWSYRRKRGLI